MSSINMFSPDMISDILDATMMGLFLSSTSSASNITRAAYPCTNGVCASTHSAMDILLSRDCSRYGMWSSAIVMRSMKSRLEVESFGSGSTSCNQSRSSYDVLVMLIVAILSQAVQPSKSSANGSTCLHVMLSSRARRGAFGLQRQRSVCTVHGALS